MSSPATCPLSDVDKALLEAYRKLRATPSEVVRHRLTVEIDRLLDKRLKEQPQERFALEP